MEDVLIALRTSMETLSESLAKKRLTAKQKMEMALTVAGFVALAKYVGQEDVDIPDGFFDQMSKRMRKTVLLAGISELATEFEKKMEASPQ